MTTEQKRKYKLTNKSIEVFGIKLYQIKALKSFGIVKKGELGGYIEKESNLSQEDNCWVSGNAWVYGNAEVSGNARVYGNAMVSGECKVEIRLCSRFNFEFQWQIDKWIKLEKEFENDNE